MAERRIDEAGFPEELYPYHPGWAKGSLAWLKANPDRRLPYGEDGDATEVYRMSIEEAQGFYSYRNDDEDESNESGDDGRM